MCIVFWSDTPNYSLVVASNRDEFLARPTTDAAWHSWDPHAPVDEPDERRRTLSGLDLTAGGTWFGISLAVEKAGGKGHAQRMHFATLTNFTEEIPPVSRPSRGELTRDFLDRVSSSSPSGAALEDYLAVVEKQKQDYAGFNLVVGEIIRPPAADSASRDTQVRLAYISNRENPSKRARVLPPLPHSSAGTIASSDRSKRVRAVSNATLEVEEGEEEWPKVKGGAAALEQVLQALERDGLSKEEQEKELVEGMYRVLSTAHPSPILHRTHLRHTVFVRPLAFDPFAPLPSIPPPFPPTSPSPSPPSSDPPKREGEDDIHWYATRVQTLLLVERGTGRVVVRERQAFVLDEEGRPRWSGKERVFEFVL
ncbi:hypothetical protein Rt10032_c13g5164 [Rhodotorula toruloides]|uniref:NRDE protein-domain containing protein n=1 Tax=Rhodotorula toruloides TaxID=5286 RepID=A0A511KL93_RHOTO|nr:hypothetical protein Rt10032_c13g5164 [Rhodotorula toruloides]